LLDNALQTRLAHTCSCNLLTKTIVLLETTYSRQSGSREHLVPELEAKAICS